MNNPQPPTDAGCVEQIELKPCPFCGGEALLVMKAPLPALHKVVCKNCDAGPHSAFRVDRAVSRWNTRAALSASGGDAAELAAADMREALLREIINSPETADFMAGVPLEAAHQRERWGVDHDAGKSPLDWFWLIGFLAQKAADAAMRGDDDKACHHTISTAAALANWHAAITGADTRMRPGIGPGNGGGKPSSAFRSALPLAKQEQS